jgi:hypothetical protein
MALIPRKKSQPRKPVTGTSYQSGGLDGIPPPTVDTELGSSQPIRIQELVPELNSPFTRAQTFSKMMNDATVDVSVRAWKTPVLGADYFVDPYSSDPVDKEVAEFIWANLAGGMTQPFLTSLEDILHLCEDGYSVVEKTHENREWTAPGKGRNTKVYTMLKKLAPRPAGTISRIVYDNNGGPSTVLHNAIQTDGTVVEKKLDISQVVIFSLNKRGGDLTGRSVLRTAYPNWYYKNHLYKIDAIQKERHGIGVPKGKLLPGHNDEDKKVLRTLLRNLRTNEEAYAIETPNVEIGFIELQGQPVDVISSIDHHNTMILLNVMAQFLALGGISSSGSRAVGGTQSDMFMKSLKYIANSICEMINMYVIPELVVWNYKTTNFPQLRVRNIGETRDLQMIASALSNLFAQKAITPDVDTENYLRTKLMDMPAKDPNSQVIPDPTVPLNGNVPTTTDKGNVKNGKGTGNIPKPANAPQ